MMNCMSESDKSKFAIGRRGLKLMIIGLVVLVAGYILLAGGGVKNPAVFNYGMFSFQRLVVAPIVMLSGIVIEIVAIMHVGKKE